MARTPSLKAICLVVLTVCLAHAQNGAPPTLPSAAPRQTAISRALDQLNSYLKLTPEQTQQIKVILGDQAKDLAMAVFACFTNKSLTKEDKAAKLKAVQTTCQTRIRSILSPDQQAKYDLFCRHSTATTP